MELKAQPDVTLPDAAAKKQPYCAPKLTRYGELAALTRSGATATIIETVTYRPISN